MKDMEQKTALATKFILNTPEEMEALGARLAQQAEAPCFVALYGDLGAGKTVFVRGAARSLGIDEVTSPTFNIVHEYDTKPRFYHFDAYRLADGDALMDMGFEEYLNGKSLLFLEWAELVEEALPKERINVTILGSGQDPRTVTIQAVGARYERMVADIC